MATKKPSGSIEARLAALEAREEELEKTFAIVTCRFADLFGDAGERARELGNAAGKITGIVQDRIPEKTWDAAFETWEKICDEADAPAAGG